VDVVYNVDTEGQRNIVRGEIRKMRGKVEGEISKFREGWTVGRMDVKVRKKNRRVGRV